MPTHVYINKLQAQVRYTHITCRYPWIREPELLIVWDALTGPKTKERALLSWAKTLRTSPSYSFKPTISSSDPTGSRGLDQAQTPVSSCGSPPDTRPPSPPLKEWT